MSVADRFIAWAVARAPYAQPVVTFEGEPLFDRFAFFRRDEWPDSLWDENRERYPKRPGALPWWLPFNAFVHRWHATTPESYHDHPRWSVTICLKGRLIEKTPWSRRELRPGSIVVRSRKSIHAFERRAGFDGEIWTLFVVGRRVARQNTFVVTPR